MHKQTLLLTSVIIVICLGFVMFAKTQWLNSVFAEQLKFSLSKTVLPFSENALNIDKINVKNSKITFRTVRLNDTEPANQVESIEANKGSAFSLFLAGHVFSDLDIHKPQVHVSWKNIDISQLFMKAFRDFHPPMPFSHLAFHDGQLHISSPFGEFKISGKSAYSNDPGGKGTFLNSHFSAAQPQLGFNANITTAYVTPHEYISEYTLQNAQIDLPFLKVNGLNGTLKSNHKEHGGITMDGRFSAENIQASDISLTETATTITGDLRAWSMLTKGFVQGRTEMMPVLIQQDYSAKQHTITARIESTEIHDLNNLLMSLKNTLSYKPLSGDILAPLMITEGNLARISQIEDIANADKYELIIAGSVHDLSGTIIATKTIDGVTSRYEETLDPGTP